LGSRRCAHVCEFAPQAAESHPEDYCHKCGGPNVVWFAPSPIWNKAVREKGEKEILCPVCFIKLAESAGFDQKAWKVAPEEMEKVDG